MANWKNREFNQLRQAVKLALEAEERAWQHVSADSDFRTELAKLLLTEEDLKVEHPTFGPMIKSWGHPSLKPLLIERIKKLLPQGD